MLLFFSRLHFRNKLLLTFLVVLIPLVLLGAALIDYQVEKILHASIDKELKAAADSFMTLIQTSAQVSVKNRLRAIAEKNQDIAQYYYKQFEFGHLDRKQMMEKISQIFLAQTVGKSGYVYCLNSKGIVTVHPMDGVRYSDLSQYDFIQEQLKIKEGYLEYDWKNPGEIKPRPKALYMVYFKPLDWIISVSGYRDEFDHLVNIDDFRPGILSHRIGKTGYGYVIDEKGMVLVHPKIQGVYLLEQQEVPREFVKQMLKEKNGRIRYFWKNPDQQKTWEKIVIFKHLPEYGWIIACSSYVQEVFEPLKTFRLFLMGIIIFSVLFSVGAIFVISRAVTRPFKVLIDKLEQGARGDFSVRMVHDSFDEFGKLANHFNSFMGQLENNQAIIEQQNKKNMEARNALVENDLKLRSLFNQSFQYTGILSPTGILEEINQSGLDFAGCKFEDVLYKPFWELPWWRHDIDVREKIEQVVKQASRGKSTRFETTSVSELDDVRHIDLSIKPVFNSLGDVAFIITEGRDITEYKLAAMERKNLAVQMEKAQKMESIGTLAGGIAHDFNNILSGILGYAQLAELNIYHPLKAKGHIAHILKGARRAARLTQQILTFSRQHEYEKMAIELGLILKEALKLLRSSIPVTIAIVEQVKSKKMVLADPTQMHQVIMNLCTNAYHAMDEAGGVLTVSLREVNIFQSSDFFDQVMEDGQYLELEIADTGVGMDQDVMAKAFDPYFTTKDVGKGTGFGLALVHAIVDEHDGYIKLRSRVGKGSNFLIYLPVVDSPIDDLATADNEITIDRGTEQVMVVDDEADIRIIVQQFLESNGYCVDVFNDGSDALNAFLKDPDKYDLIVTDMTMPNMTGYELSKQVLNIRKDMPIILCTGYSENVSESQALEIGIRKYIHKPLTNEELSAAVREVIDQQKE
ncbi:MAG: cache domain-containing protein [Pseudomonadota bacterium]